MKRIFINFSKGAVLTGISASVVECILILTVDKTIHPWILLQSGIFWFGCGFIVYKLNRKRRLMTAVFYTVFMNLPWFIALSLANGKTEHFVPLVIASLVMGLGIGLLTKLLSPKAEVTVEWAPFELLENVVESKLMDASQILQTSFLESQKGFLKRELLHYKDKKWVDLIYWENQEFAKSAMKKAMESEHCLPYFQLMKPMDEKEDTGILLLTKKGLR